MKRQRLWILGLAAIALCWSFTALVFHFVEAEPMTAEQILAKTDWKPEQLAEALSSAALESESLEKRQAVMDHVRALLQKLPEQRRREIFEEITSRRLERFRQYWQRLSVEEQKKIVEQRLEEIREHNQKLTPEEREKLKERLQSPEGHQFMKSAMERFNRDLSVDERAALTPLVREWLTQLDSL